MHSHATIEVGVRRLLGRQFDCTTDGAATDFFRAAVRRFHNARTTAGHDGEPEARDGCTHFPCELVMRIVALNPG
jgi:hypothetical protein